jgi:competence protein ComEC
MLPPLSWVALAFLSGLVIADLSIIPLSASSIATAGTILLWVVLFFGRKPRSWLLRKHHRLGVAPILLALFCLLGILRLQTFSLPITQHNLAWYNDEAVVRISGNISDYPDRRETYQLLTVNAESVSFKYTASTNTSISGRVIVRTGIDKYWAYGDAVQLTGRLTTPSDEADFSYRDYLARQSINSSLYYPEIVLIARGRGNAVIRWIYNLREKGLITLAKLYPMPESALLSGILLGVDNDIPEDIQTSFRATGTTHIIAISGFNISILAGLFSSIYYRLLGPRKGALVTVLTLFIYVILTGASPAVIRAAIMGSLGLFASLVGRRQTGVNSLTFVAAIMCLYNPYLPWDISFQLSFLSTLGLILFAEPMVNWLKRILTRFLPSHSLENLADAIGEYCLFTFAALITTFPVMAYHFGSFSWSALITNPMILPAQPLVMILGGLSLLLGLLWLPLGQLMTYLAWPFVAYTIKVVEWLGNLTGNEPGSLSTGMGFILVYYLVLILFVSKVKIPGIKRIFQPNIIIVVCMAIIVCLWRAGLSLPDGKLHVYLIDNGPIENVLIRSPQGRYLLINAGSQSNTLADALGKRLPPLGRQLDTVFLPVSDKTAIRSLRHGMSGIAIDTLVWLGDPSGLATSRDLEASLDIRNIRNSVDLSGMEYRLSNDARLTYRALQEDGGAFRIQWENFCMLIPINMDDPSWLEAILAEPIPYNYTVILLTGNGSPELNPPSLVRHLNPTLILIVSDPGESGWEANSQGSVYMSTEQTGWVHITTDGKQMWTETARGTE